MQHHAHATAATRHHVAPTSRALDRMAAMATLHCLLGCAVGEVAGMVLGTALGLANGATIALSITLAFVSGFGATAVPLWRSGLRPAEALRIALAADTFSIAVMEVVDSLAMVTIPGAMDAPLDTPRFWASLAASLVLAGLAAYPVNRWLLARGQGHALSHPDHCHGGHA